MIVLYHANCVDGFTSAYLAYKVYGNAAQYFAVNYGEAPPYLENEEVLILDFSYPRDVLLELKEKNCWLKVIDHHKTASAALEGLDFCIFDMHKSGAQLTEEYFSKRTGSQYKSQLVRYTADRDLWKWELPDSREISAAIASYDQTFDNYRILEHYMENSFMILVREGLSILRYQQKTIDGAIKNATIVEIHGHKVPHLNTTTLISEIGEALCKSYPFSATWFESNKGERIYSLRSNAGTGIDVSEIAKKYGGGGHKNAAGFKLPIGGFYRIKSKTPMLLG